MMKFMNEHTSENTFKKTKDQIKVSMKESALELGGRIKQDRQRCSAGCEKGELSVVEKGEQYSYMHAIDFNGFIFIINFFRA